MADEIKDYAGGWITEKKGTDVPTFLKFAYIVIMAGCIGYAIIYMNGEVDHPERGPIVQQFNRFTTGADTLMYAVAGLVVVYTIILVLFAFNKKHED